MMRILEILLYLVFTFACDASDIETNLLENAKLVARLNSDPNDHALYELNQFATLSVSEFQQRLMPKQKVPQQIISKRKDFPVYGQPLDSFDWEEIGAVTTVKDQGSVGTCWAFSTAANIEGQMFIQKQKSANLSVEQFVECDASADPNGNNGAGSADCGVFGGWPYLAFDFAKNTGGVYQWEEWPYCVSPPRHSTLEQCWPCMADGYSKSYCGNHADMYCNASSTMGQGSSGYCASSDGAIVQVIDWDAVSTNETEIAQFLVATGPLSVLMNAETLSFYKSGIYSPQYCNPEDLDHAVLLVGYGTDNGVDYWRVKNSWGASWGEDGYFRILRGSGKCGINTAVTTSYVA